MEFGILGPLTVTSGGREVTPRGARERLLLGELLLDAGRVVPADLLIDRLWHDRLPANPTNALQALITRLRRSLGTDVVHTRDPGYLLAIEPEQLDAARFERLTARARAVLDAHPATAARLLADALSLWRGRPLPELVDDEAARPELERLEELRLAAVEDRVEAELALGRHAELVPDLERLIGEHPLRERARRQLMVALYRSGRQADALAVYAATRRLLADELGLDPGRELRELQEAILRQDPALDAPRAAIVGVDAPQHNLPLRLTSFVGRATDAEQIRIAIAGSRMVTLVGPGGAGKTSLAVEVARGITAGYPHGVWFVELGRVDDDALVPAAVAAAVGLPPAAAAEELTPRPIIDRLADYLRRRDMVLVLDNCEHLVTPCAALAETVLRAAAEVRILATSREALGVPGEVVYPTPSLAVPDERAGPEALAASPAVRLFLDRAIAARPDLDCTNADAVRLAAQICRRLDGLPLAIELAAARARSLSLAELAHRLDDRFRLLTSALRSPVPRHQTLRATIDWSHRLLTGDEQLLFARLAVFVGGWTTESAEEVCADEALASVEVLDLLTSLVDRSLVVADPQAGRFRMLDTIREYAWERLKATPAGQATVARHGVYFLGLADAARRRHAEQRWWRPVLDAERDNLRAAIDRAVERGAVEVAQALVAALTWYWFLGPRQEGVQRIEAMLDRPATDRSVRARLLQALALVHLFGPTEGSMRAARESVDLLLAEGDEPGAALSRVLVAVEGAHAGERETSLAQLAQARPVFTASGDRWALAFAGFVEMLVHARAGALDAAVAAGEPSVEGFRDTGDEWALSATLSHLADAMQLRGEFDRAAQLYSRALELTRRLGLPHGTQYVLAALGTLSAWRGDFDRAEHLLREALTTARDVGNERGVEGARNGLGYLARRRGEPALAADRHRAALTAHRALQVPWTSSTFFYLAAVSQELGQGEQAAELCREGVVEAHKRGDPAETALGFEVRAALMAADGDVTHAISLLGAAARIRRDSGAAGAAGDQLDVRHAATLRDDLLARNPDLAGPHADGMAMSVEQAVLMALA